MNLHARRLRKKDLKALSPEVRRVARRIANMKPDFRILAEAAQTRILDELNRHPMTAAAKRVARIIELFNEAKELNDSFRLFFETRDDMRSFFYETPEFVRFGRNSKEYYSTGFKFTFPKWDTRVSPIFAEMEKCNEKLNQVLRELCECTASYKWHPLVRHAGYEVDLDVVYHWKAKSEMEEWENSAVFWLTAKNGEYVERIRRCSECEKWFFALVEHQTYCSDNCRKRYASHSEGFKQKRAKYMREYRKGEKEKGKRALRQAREILEGERRKAE